MIALHPTASRQGDGSQMIECRGVVKSLPPAKNGEWVIKRAAGSDIPYVSDGEAGTKKWCMEFFQAATATGGKTDGISDMPPSLDLNQVTEAPSSSSGVAVPQSDMKQLPPGASGQDNITNMVNMVDQILANIFYVEW